ncbi:MAG TPA: dNTP triphosphohydrolase [Rhodopila sp.]|nr:dNTP triphosphohydrolase [Rhodopila sp.]
MTTGWLDWGKLLSDGRFPRAEPEDRAEPGSPPWMVNSRTETERDFDRILFATPTRRLGDKTQVFPLERNESIRNRLTHSYEVANLARSIGTHVVYSDLGARIVEEASGTLGRGCADRVRRAVPAILSAIGLAHDLGNPPFGHQGEEAVRHWVRANEREIFGVSEKQKAFLGERGANLVHADLERMTPRQRDDFRHFEGNAQTLRTLTRLQVVKDNRGLNLTFGTLSALMKYTVPSDRAGRHVHGEAAPAATRKVGYFTSEAELVERIRQETGLPGYVRHPLTYIMEACDDIAYLIIDAEDAIKKQLVSFADLMAWLENRQELFNDEFSQWILRHGRAGACQARDARLPPSEINDVSMQIFRANAISAMVSAVIRAFEDRYDTIMTTGLDEPLLDLSIARPFAEAIKDFDFQHAYRNRRVLEIELSGFNTIHGLLDLLWRGITEREDFDNPASRRTSPFARYAYGRISENYRRVFEGRVPPPVDIRTDLPIRYRELQLLTDMIAGMTDQFAIDLHEELERFNVGASTGRR